MKIQLHKKILNSSLRQSTRNKYRPYQKRWIEYCTKHSIMVQAPKVEDILNFLSDIFDRGGAYSAINSAKCALSKLVNIPPYKQLNDHMIIAQYCIHLNLSSALYGMLKLFLTTLLAKAIIFISRARC